MTQTEPIPTYPVYSIFGERHTLLLTGEQTGGAYAVVEALVLPGGGPPYHVHPHQDEAFIVLRGEFEFTVAGKKVRASAGGTLAVPRGVPHKFTVVGSEPGLLVGTVSPAGLERFFAAAGTRLRGRDAAPVAATSEQVERALRLLPEYGMELKPDPARAASLPRNL